MTSLIGSRVAAGLSLSLLLSAGAFGQDGHTWEHTTIAGNEIAWSCEGDGAPTIALIAGGGLDAHNSYSRIYHNYDGPGRICMYDRAGMGESTFATPRTRSLAELEDELHELSVQAGWGDLVLVAHSFGGFIARAYASEHQNEVLGILFLDAEQEDWLPRLEAEMSAEDWAIMARILDWNTRTFHEDFIQAQEAVRATQLAEHLPITVISRGIPHVQIRLEKMSYRGVDLYDGEHNVLQEKLARLSTDSEHRIARYSSHMINDFDPWLVIDEIGLLLARATQRPR